MVPVFFMEKVVGQCVWHCLDVVVSRDSDFKLYDCGFGIWRGFLITGQFMNIGVSGNNVEKGPDARLLLEQM